MRPWVSASFWLVAYMAFVAFVAWDSTPGDWNPVARFAVALMGFFIAWSAYYLTPAKKP